MRHIRWNIFYFPDEKSVIQLALYKNIPSYYFMVDSGLRERGYKIRVVGGGEHGSEF
jgi:hypothetical protein